MNLKINPFYPALAEYENYKWLIFGTLTHSMMTSASSQVKNFNLFIDQFARGLSTRGNRLHWVLRVEGKQPTNPNSLKNTHLHFLLGSHKVTDSKKIEVSVEDASARLEAMWPHGISQITPYESDKSGVSYVLKAETLADAQDQVLLSKAIYAYLQRRKAFWAKYRDRNDDFLVQMLWDLQQSAGGGISFASEVLLSRSIVQ